MRKKYLQLLGVAAVVLLIGIPAWGLDAPVVTATAKGPNQINLTWGTVSNPGYGYKVEIQSPADSRYASWTDISTTQNGRNYIPYWVTEAQYKDPLDATSGDGTTCQFPVFGLKTNTAYNFRMRSYAKNDSGTSVYSAYSATASATTPNYTVRYVSTSGSNSNSGTSPSSAWRNISYAGQQATPGTVVYIMGGSYSNDYLAVSTNGSPGSKIVFQANPGETVSITSGNYYGSTGYISGSYVVVDGLKANYGSDSAENWMITGNRNAIVNCDLGSVTKAGYATLVKVSGTYNLIHNNYLHDIGTGPDGNEAGTTCTLFGTTANRNVVQFNHMSRGTHDTGLVKNGASYNKWLNNLHDGGWGLGWECVSDSGGSCMYNLYEGNEVVAVRAAGTAEVYKPGIEVSGDYNTVRRNVIRDGAQSATHAVEISRQTGYGAANNLIYNNVFYHNQGVAINFMDASSTNNLIANNIMYYNGLSGPYTGTPGLEVFAHTTATLNVKNNLILYKSSAGVEDPNGLVINEAYGTSRTVAYANTNLSGFAANITATPNFISESGADFHLKSLSQAINTGITVTDSVWGTLLYRGTAPDIGAYEYSDAGASSGGGIAPTVPRNLRLIP